MRTFVSTRLIAASVGVNSAGFLRSVIDNSDLDLVFSFRIVFSFKDYNLLTSCAISSRGRAISRACRVIPPGEDLGL